MHHFIPIMCSADCHTRAYSSVFRSNCCADDLYDTTSSLAAIRKMPKSIAAKDK